MVGMAFIDRVYELDPNANSADVRWLADRVENAYAQNGRLAAEEQDRIWNDAKQLLPEIGLSLNFFVKVTYFLADRIDYSFRKFEHQASLAAGASALGTHPDAFQTAYSSYPLFRVNDILARRGGQPSTLLGAI